ncbi:MAG: T9SS type A sorting domain-containing protein [Flavobacteriales bacterium]
MILIHSIFFSICKNISHKFFLYILFVLIFKTSYSQQKNWRELIVDPKIKFEEIKTSFDEEWKNKEYEKGKGFKQFYRWQNFWENRLLSNGDFPNFSKGFNEFVNFQSSFSNPANTDDDQWNPIGPIDYQYSQSWSPGQGRVNCIEQDPNNSQIIYVGTPAGGIWKSVDGGINWLPKSDFLSVIGISSIAINPSNSNEIYIATGDADGGDTYSIGIWKSVDGGDNWTQTSFQNFQANKLEIDPNDNDKIWAASSSGLFKSENGGLNWELVHNDNVRDFSLAPNNSDIFYFSTSNEVFYSLDGGQSITQSQGLLNDKSRIAITVSNADPNSVYILTAAPDQSFAGVYKSENNGQNFYIQNNTTDIFDQSNQAYYDMAIVVSDQDPNFLVAGVLNLWKSNDGGINWTPVNYWNYPEQNAYTHADIHFLKYFDNNLYCGSDGGIYKSTDNALSFTDLSQKLQIGQFYKISSNQTNPYVVSGGLQDNGGFYYNGQDWTVWHGADGMESIINPYNSSEVFGMSQFGQLYSSTDGQTINFLNAPEDGRWITPMQYDSINNKIIAGYSQLYSYSNINGWQVISNFNFPSLISQIEIYQNNSDTIYLSEGSNIYLSTDGGLTVSQLNSPSNQTITSIEVNKTNANELWIVLGGWSQGQKVFHSTDMGSSWQNISYNLPNLPANVIKRHHSNNSLYLGMDIGVYNFNSELNLWTSFNSDLPNVIVNDIEINEVFNLVTIGTYGRGVWQSNVNTSELDSIGIYAFQIDSIDEFSCSNSITPVVSYLNIGTNNINSLLVNYSINGNTSPYLWQGNVSSGNPISFELPEIQNLNDGEYTITVEILEVNGQEYSTNFTDLDFDFYSSTGQEYINFNLITDCYASETTFSLFDENDQLVYFQNNSLTNYSNNQYNWCLQPSCYTLVVYDSYGDGMQGTSYSCDSDGTFYLYDQNNELIFDLEQANFGSEISFNFCIEETILGCTDPIAINYNELANTSDGSCEYENYLFCDDFESYNNGDQIAQSSDNWETWATSYNSNLQPPYADDAPITSAFSINGNNALYFPYSENGGPQDIVLPFTQQSSISNGYFEISFHIFVSENTGAYFNFQQNHTPGNWLMNVFIEQNQLSLSNGFNLTYFETSISNNNWNHLKFKFDLSNGKTELIVNENLVFSDTTEIYEIGALNLYPIDNNEFWIDDICYIVDSEPFGCTDPTALNYDSEAYLSDNSICCYPINSTDTQEHCDQFTWIDGNTYTESNTSATHTITNSNNCDSIITLDLTINYSSFINESITACDSYDWNGQNYNVSGDYTYIGTNISGCPETNILSLVINESDEIVDQQNHCDQYTWIDGITYNESNSTAFHTLTNSNNCDSVIYLDLIINYSNVVNESVTSCDSFEWNGQNYNESGQYTYIGTNTSGCPETNILSLIINESTSSYDSVIACTTFEWNGIEYLQSGNYTFEDYNANNCDSIANLNLIISDLNNLEIDGPNTGLVETSNNIYSILNSAEGSTYHWYLSEQIGTIESANNDSSQISVNWGGEGGNITLCVYEEDQYGCLGQEYCIEIDILRPTSIEVKETIGLNVFPNPFTNETTVRFSNPKNEIANIQLLDSKGRVVKKYSNINTERFTIKKNDLSTGLYFVKLKLNNQIHRATIILQ